MIFAFILWFLFSLRIRFKGESRSRLESIDPTLKITSLSRTETLSQPAGIFHIFCTNLHIHHQPKLLRFLVVHFVDCCCVLQYHFFIYQHNIVMLGSEAATRSLQPFCFLLALLIFHIKVLVVTHSFIFIALVTIIKAICQFFLYIQFNYRIKY